MVQTRARKPLDAPASPAETARDMVRVVLAGWASDCLRLRAARMDRPSARPGRGLAALGTGTGAAAWTGPTLPRWAGGAA